MLGLTPIKFAQSRKRMKKYNLKTKFQVHTSYQVFGDLMCGDLMDCLTAFALSCMKADPLDARALLAL